MILILDKRRFIINNMKNIKLIRPLEWEEVFLFWYQNEGTQASWLKHAKERGFESWAEWRLTYTKLFECAESKWGLYEITNPAKVVSDFYGGPFRAWINRFYEGAKEKSFSELASMQTIQDHKTIKSMVKNFPQDQKIVCLNLGGKIYTIEGTHRCCALAIMHRKKLKSPEKLLIAIGESSLSELPIVGRERKK